MTGTAADVPSPTSGPQPAADPRHLRLLRAPDTEPPVTSRRAADGSPPMHRRPSPASVAGTPFQGTLALLFTLPTGAPVEPPPRTKLRLASYQPHRHYGPDDDDYRDPPVPTSTVDLPDPRRWAARLVQAAVEVRTGDRPAAQLLRWSSREVYERLLRDVTPRTRRSTPSLVRRARPVLRSLHLSEPADGVVELCAVVQDGRRARAVAARLEGLDGRWLCTAFELV